MKKSLNCIVILTALCLSVFYLSAQNIYYIDNTATGANNGTSWENAWNSFANINWADISPGDSVFISGGSDQKIYDEVLNIQTAGAESAYVTIRVGQSEGHRGKVIIGQGIKIRYSKNFIVIDGNYNNKQHIVVKNPDDRGINIYNSENVIVKYVEVANCGNGSDEHGIHVNFECHKITIDNCYIHNVYQDGINFNCSGIGYDDFVVSNTKIENPGDDGIQTVGGLTVHDSEIITDRVNHAPGAHPDGIQLNPELTHLKVYNSVIKNFSQNIFVEQSRGNVMIYNNIICQDDFSVSGTGRGVAIGPSDEVPTEGPFVVVNNVFYNFNSYHALMAGTWEPGPFEEDDEVAMENNIFYNNRIHFGGQIEFLSANNIFYNSPDMVYYNSDGTVITGDGGEIPTGSLNEDPKFEDVASHNFKLLKESIAIDKGTSFDNYGITSDKIGVPRPQGGAWDMGAFEFESITEIINKPIKNSINIVPNPFIDKAFVEYEINEPSKVNIVVFNVFGQRVLQTKTLAQLKGIHRQELLCKNLTKGIYFVQVQVNEKTHTIKAIIGE